MNFRFWAVSEVAPRLTEVRSLRQSGPDQPEFFAYWPLSRRTRGREASSELTARYPHSILTC